MQKGIIYTLDYIKASADDIAGYWNGSDERFIGGDGDSHTDDEAQTAIELLEKIKEVEELISLLDI